MQNKILIITTVGDTHSYMVAKALEKKGVKPVLWHTTDYPAQGNETIKFTSSGIRIITVSDTEIEMENPFFTTIWRRRPYFTINEKILHPSDQEYAQYQCQNFRNSLYSLLSPNAFWINPRENAIRSNLKIIQNKFAIETGFKTPYSLYSNDPKQIRKFIKENNGVVVFKPLQAIIWGNPEFIWTNLTKLIREKDLVDDNILRSTPAIYQELIQKSYELRITMMGKHAFGAKIFSQQTDKGKLDWRQSYDELKIEYWEVPNKLSDLCYKLLQKLGLVFGCFDFIVTPENECIFLEVNQMGQFLFLERYMEFPLLDAFTEFLIQGRINFKWKIKKNSIMCRDIETEVTEFNKYVQNKHSISKYVDENINSEERIIK